MIGARDPVEPQAGHEARSRHPGSARIERAMRASPASPARATPTNAGPSATRRHSQASPCSIARRALVTDDLARAWVEHAKARLVDPKTGILVSSYTVGRRVLDGAEGSSIWMSAHNLLFVDEVFARDQYARARRELGASFLGFGWAREWPASAGGSAPTSTRAPSCLSSTRAQDRAASRSSVQAPSRRALVRGLLSSLELTAFRRRAHGALPREQRRRRRGARLCAHVLTAPRKGPRAALGPRLTRMRCPMKRPLWLVGTAALLVFLTAPRAPAGWADHTSIVAGMPKSALSPVLGPRLHRAPPRGGHRRPGARHRGRPRRILAAGLRRRQRRHRPTILRR